MESPLPRRVAACRAPREGATAMADAFYPALERAGGDSLENVVSESGWPSAGGGPETSIDNARIYNTNMVQLVKNGTKKEARKAD